jgi:hypothetical protein
MNGWTHKEETMHHQSYKPTKIEELYIAAGWLTLANCDPEYIDYCQNYVGHPMERLEYDNWQYFRQQWNDLNDTYIREFPDPFADTPWYQRNRQDSLLRAMLEVEVMLGY